MVVLSEPSAAAVAVPSGTFSVVQHVPVQLTRFPTTDAHWRSTGAFGVRPFAVRPTFVRMSPAVVLSEPVAAVTPFGTAFGSIVVKDHIVGATLSGQSTAGFGRPASFVT